MKTKNKSFLAALTAIIIAMGCCSCQSASRAENAEIPNFEVVTPAMASATADSAVATGDSAGDALDRKISEMTIEEKVAQMFLVSCPEVDPASVAASYQPGGYVLFGTDFADKTEDEVKENIKSYQDASKIPMLIAVDEEGGTVVRVSGNFGTEAFRSPRDTYANGGWSAIESDENKKADLLLSLGINVNLAPVCDIVTSEDSFMYDRAFSDQAGEVAQYSEKVVTIYKTKKLGSVLKHFPGYGDNSDTHIGAAVDEREYSSFQQSDFLPFKSGIEAGAGAVMVSHNIINTIDADNPASLSSEVHKVLRDELDFNGVIMTDDLSMDAIVQFTSGEDAAVAAVKSGNDIICCSDFENRYSMVLQAVQNGEISEARINDSVKRILIWKQSLGLI